MCRCFGKYLKVVIDSYSNMIIADVHAHLDMMNKEELAAVIERAAAAGVKVIINNSVDPKSGRKSLELQQQFKIVKAALGLYPTEAAKMTVSEVGRELDFIRSNKSKIVAIGEIGLDYEQAGTNKEKQQLLFEQQIGLAKELDIPAIVHSRKAEKEVVETLIRCECNKAVLHAFHGSIKLVKMAADAGFYITIPTNIGRSSHFQAVVRELPVSRLLTETDAPFLAAEKGSGSEPAHIAKTIKAIAGIKGLTAEETANVIYSNYQKLFL